MAPARAPILGLLVAAVLLILPGLASAAVNQGRPLAVAGTDASDLQVFWRDGAGDLIDNQETAGTWGSPSQSPLSGLASDPAVVSSGGTDYIFWEGADQNLVEATDTGGSFSAPTEIASGPLGSQPTVVAWTPFAGVTELFVYWQGTDGNLYQDSWLSSTGQWSGAANEGAAPLYSAPSASDGGNAMSGGQIFEFWQSSDGDLEQDWQTYTGNGAAPSDRGPDDLGVPISGAPTAAISSGASQTQQVFWQNASGDLSEATYGAANAGSSGWGGENTGIGPVGSAPTALGFSNGTTDIFWESGGNLWEAIDNNGTFSDVQSQGSLTPPPAVQSAPQAVSIAAPSAAPTSTGKTGTTKKAKPAIHVKITFHATWDIDRTRIRDLEFSKIPAKSGVRISCEGRRCPRNLGVTSRRLKLATLVKHLESDTLRVGQTIVITIGHSGYTSEKIALTVRRSTLPAAKLL